MCTQLSLLFLNFSFLLFFSFSLQLVSNFRPQTTKTTTSLSAKFLRNKDAAGGSSSKDDGGGGGGGGIGVMALPVEMTGVPVDIGAVGDDSDRNRVRIFRRSRRQFYKMGFLFLKNRISPRPLLRSSQKTYFIELPPVPPG